MSGCHSLYLRLPGAKLRVFKSPPQQPHSVTIGETPRSRCHRALTWLGIHHKADAEVLASHEMSSIIAAKSTVCIYPSSWDTRQYSKHDAKDPYSLARDLSPSHCCRVPMVCRRCVACSAYIHCRRKLPLSEGPSHVVIRTIPAGTPHRCNRGSLRMASRGLSILISFIGGAKFNLTLRPVISICCRSLAIGSYPLSFFLLS